MRPSGISFIRDRADAIAWHGAYLFLLGLCCLLLAARTAELDAMREALTTEQMQRPAVYPSYRLPEVDQ